MKQIEKIDEKLVSLNTKFSEFNLQELENRLETNPLSVGGLLNMNSSDYELFYDCNAYNCGEMICMGYNF